MQAPEKYQASSVQTLWALTWPGLRKFRIVKAKTAREAYQKLDGTVPAFSSVSTLRAG